MRGDHSHNFLLSAVFGILLLAGNLALIPQARAQMFQNQFIEFKIPENWECRAEGTEWVCMSNNPKIKKETIVVFAAKLAGPQDTLKEYMTYLQKPRHLTDLEGKSIESVIRYTKNKDVGGHTWVDSVHIHGEIPGFITRYLATTYQELGILVTYSVLESRWDAYEGMFRRMVDTLKPRHGTGPEVAQEQKTMTNIPISSLLEKQEKEPQESPEALVVAEETPPPPKSNTGLFLLIGLGVIGVILLLLRQRKKSAQTKAEGNKEDEEDFDDDDV